MRVAERRVSIPRAGVLLAMSVGLLVILGGQPAEADPGGPVPNPGHAWVELQGHGDDGDGAYVSTEDNQAFEIRVNGDRALRLEPDAASPNIIGGHSGNSVTDGAHGAAICGGGATGEANRVTDDYGTVSGGADNRAGDNAGTTSDAPYATIGGGHENIAMSSGSTVGGGIGNTAGGGAFPIGNATVGGGWHNGAYGDYSVVCGGESNTASGGGATIAGGQANLANETWSTIGGGRSNVASGSTATVAGGQLNTASGDWAAVGGGYSNMASGAYSSVLGGLSCMAQGDYSFAGGRRAKANHQGSFVWADSTDADFVSTAADQFLVRASGGVGLAVSSGGLRLEPDATSPNVIGGYGGNSVMSGVVGAAICGGGGDFYAGTNDVTDNYGAIAGGGGNRVGDNAGTTTDAPFNTVGGGEGNVAGAAYCVGEDCVGHATVGGGQYNSASGDFATTVGGGYHNTANASYATIGGGHWNEATGTYASIGGGNYNTCSASSATVGGGTGNNVTDDHGTVGGGSDNQAGDNAGSASDRPYATVSGGYANEASGEHSTISGGQYNTVSSGSGTVGGGQNNSVSDQHATVGGGGDNDASGAGATVSGGTGNSATGIRATVGGGRDNGATGDYSSVSGGWGNYASNTNATVGGGYNNSASYMATVPGGYYNAAAGDYSLAAGRRAKANNQGCFVWGDSTDADVACNVNDRFITRASGGVYLYTNSTLSSGAYLASGSGAWSSVSDASLKENFTAVNGREVVAALAEIPITTWNYTTEDSSVRHMGPTAQDLYAAFGLGDDERYISTIDAEGVALAAIQGLYELVQEQESRIETLEARVTALEGGAPVSGDSESLSSSMLPTGWLLLAGLFVVGGLVVAKRRLVGGHR